ncbi:MAG: hypothetical protein HUU50_10845 [Candidatus Brocadiae bacterium]|nr:hypothetical protein [Candidatus Brocadiia bacterium]
MQSIWISEIKLQPAGALTFRRMPSGLLHIMSYPFMPPTTMSGFLKRVLEIASGKDWPGYGEDWYNGPESKEFTLTLEQDYRCLGAFPDQGRWYIHKTRRHGPKHFKHTEFSKLLRSNYKENYELHHWDYLFCESLTGWVASREKAKLDALHIIQNYGGKAGKEGYLCIKKIQEPRQVFLNYGDFKPLGLVTLPLRPKQGCFYHLYAHHWNKNYPWSNGEKGGVDGYIQVNSWWEADSANGFYWQWDKGIGFAASVVDTFLQGDVDAFWNNYL